jgi:hypothetical protein
VAAHRLLSLSVGGASAAALWPDVTAEQREHAIARVRCDIELRHHVLRAISQHFDDVARERRLVDPLMPVDGDVKRRFTGVSGLENSRSQPRNHQQSVSTTTTAAAAGHVEVASSGRQVQLETRAQCVALARVLFDEYERMGASERNVKRNAKSLPALVLEAFTKVWLLLTANDDAGIVDMLSVSRAVFEREYEEAEAHKSSHPSDSGAAVGGGGDDDVVEQQQPPSSLSSGVAASDQRRRDLASSGRRQYMLGRVVGALFGRVAALLAIEATPVRECELLLQCITPLASRLSGGSADKLTASVSQALRARDEAAALIKNAGVARALVTLLSTCEMRVGNVDTHKDLLKVATGAEQLLGSCDRSRMPSEVDDFSCVIHNASVVHVVTALQQAIDLRFEAAESAIEYAHRVLAACPMAMQLVRSVATSGVLLDIDTLLVKKEGGEALPTPTPPPLAPIAANIHGAAAAAGVRAKASANSTVAAALPALEPMQRRSVALLASSVLLALDNVYATVRLCVAMLYRMTIAAQPPACAERQTRLLTRVMKLLTACVRDASSVATRRQPTQKLLKLCTSTTQYMFKQTSTWLTYLSDLPIRAASIRKLNLGKKRARARVEGDDDDDDDNNNNNGGDDVGEESEENEGDSALALLQKQQMDVKRVERDAKLVPSLVESLERFHTMLLKFEKYVKIDELTNTVPQSSAREFQLDIEALRRQGKLLAQQHAPMGDGDDGDDDDDDDDGGELKKTKRARHQDVAAADQDGTLDIDLDEDLEM